MSLKTNQKGFTIVELLIVIVVIAILAAISLVAYGGIQNRARTSSGQQNASQVEKKAMAYYTVENKYPADYNEFDKVQESKLEGLSSEQLKIADTINADDAKGGTVVAYKICGNGEGAKVSYYDFSKPDVVTKTLGEC